MQAVRAFAIRFVRAHALLVAAMVAASVISAVVYELTGGGGPKSRERFAARLNVLDLTGDKPAAVWRDGEFECLGWRGTHNCDPFGPRDPFRDRGCNDTMPRTGGYCEVRNRTSGQVLRVMLSTCKSWQWALVPSLSCDDARAFTDFSLIAAEYEHPPPKTLPPLPAPNVDDATATDEDRAVAAAVAEGIASKRGIVLVAYPKVIAGVYAIVRTLRYHGCLLPVELWIDPMEMRPKHSVLVALVRHYNCYVRIIHDPHATKFHAKPYAIYHSRFESLLFLDSDNIPVRDPTYLFDSPEFRKHGAIFWPDFWRPMVRTPFNVHEQSALWRLLDMPFTDMFEQESGQILVNRTRSRPALSKLMFYSAHLPRLVTDWQLVWGDKDLFRLAWLNTSTPFHMVQHLVMLGGLYDPIEDFFCGVAMVQRDPDGDILFMHRNQAKLTGKTDQKVLMTHVQKFIGGDGTARSLAHDLDKYRVQCKLRRLGQWTCFHIRPDTQSGSTTPYLIKSLETTKFPQVEKQAIHFSIEGRSLFTSSEEAEVAAIEERELAKQELETRLSDEEDARVVKRWKAVYVIGFVSLVLLLVRCNYTLRRPGRARARSRVSSKHPTSPAVEVTVSVDVGKSEANADTSTGESSSVVVTHGENRRRKTSFQIEDA